MKYFIFPVKLSEFDSQRSYTYNLSAKFVSIVHIFPLEKNFLEEGNGEKLDFLRKINVV